MIDEYKLMLDGIGRLNNYVNGCMITAQELSEEVDKLRDFNVLIEELRGLTQDLHQKSNRDIDTTMNQISLLHLDVTNYMWHIAQMRNLMEKCIGLYREKVFLKDIEL